VQDKRLTVCLAGYTKARREVAPGGLFLYAGEYLSAEMGDLLDEALAVDVAQL
jgi:hypothetical protein